MSDTERQIIEIPEICRVEGHSAVTVDIQDNKVSGVQLNVFEGTRLFERIVIGHKFDEIPHITSRVCAICSTGHILAAIQALEKILNFTADKRTQLYRELMHLGMIIESHATHICALALPDFLGTPDLMDFANRFKREFETWTALRNLGSSIQATIGGRPFHPVNVHVGKLSSEPDTSALKKLLSFLDENMEVALYLYEVISKITLPIERTAPCIYAALIPEDSRYNFFGNTIKTSEGWQASIDDYKEYLGEKVVAHSHAKRSQLQGKPFMVGAMARLHLFGDLLRKESRSAYEKSALSRGQTNTIWNNLAQSIEIIEAIERSKEIISELLSSKDKIHKEEFLKPKSGKAVGAVECPRGTLYHFYALDDNGKVTSADMVTPSAQNTARIEEDIRIVAEDQLRAKSSSLQKNLETLIRAYDPCNTCATHMVQIRYKGQNND